MESKLNIVQAFETFTDSHGQIQRFHFEFEEQLNQFATADTGYPILYIVPLDDGSTQQLTDYGFRVYCFDIIDKDRSNLKFAYNNTNLIVQDFLRYFDNSNSEISTFTITSKGNIQPLNNQLVDYCVGCYVDVYFQVEGVSLCDIPFIDGIPTITTSEQLEINHLLTCNNLGSCSTFTDAIDNLQNEIDNIEVDIDTFFTFDFTEELSFTLYADRDYRFTSITNVLGNPSVTILVDSSPYTLGELIQFGSKVDVIVDQISVIKIEVENE